MDFKILLSGLVAVALVTAVGLHAQSLASLAGSASTGGSRLLHTAETGN